jgi:hypothetical protein
MKLGREERSLSDPHQHLSRESEENDGIARVPFFMSRQSAFFCFPTLAGFCLLAA